MQCPKCGQNLRPSKKDPAYMLCYECKKKFNISGETAKKSEKQSKYSNIPPKSVRDKKEKEMRNAYVEMLSTEEEPRRRKGKRREEFDDDFDAFDDDGKISKAPVIILGVAIIVVAALIIYMLLK